MTTGFLIQSRQLQNEGNTGLSPCFSYLVGFLAEQPLDVHFKTPMERGVLAWGSVREHAFSIPRTPSKNLGMKILDMYPFITPDINPFII